jgi:DNA-binding transcriptional LysR family regulator
LDLAVARIFEPNAAPHLVAEILYDEPHIVAAGPLNPLSRRREIQLADLMQAAWVLSPLDSLTGLIVRDAFTAAGLPVPQAAIVTSSTPARHALVASGRCLSILPAAVLARAGSKPKVKALPIDLAQSSRPIGIITLQGRTISPAAQSFIDCARAMAEAWRDSGIAGREPNARALRPLDSHFCGNDQRILIDRIGRDRGSSGPSPRRRERERSGISCD